MGAGKNPRSQVTRPLYFNKTTMDVENEQVEAAPAPVVEDEPLDFDSAVKKVMYNAMGAFALFRGIRESAKKLDKGEVQMCFLAEDCNEAGYTRLVEALCLEHAVPLVKVPLREKLGEFAGLCKIDSEGEARKITACSCAVITDFGAASPALEFLRDLQK